MTDPTIRALVARSRADQGLPPVVRDPSAIGAVARLVRSTKKAAPYANGTALEVDRDASATPRRSEA